jgi:hypothetical protein
MKVIECLIKERFEWLEKHGPATVSEFASRMWISKDAARVWLSRMTAYKRPGGFVKAYLIYDPPIVKSKRKHGVRTRNEGTYRINPTVWWGEMFYAGNG